MKVVLTPDIVITTAGWSVPCKMDVRDVNYQPRDKGEDFVGHNRAIGMLFTLGEGIDCEDDC